MLLFISDEMVSYMKKQRSWILKSVCAITLIHVLHLKNG